MRTIELASESDATIWETINPGTVKDELGPATTIDDPIVAKPPITSLKSSFGGMTVPPQSFFKDRSEDPNPVSHGMKITGPVNPHRFKTRHFCRSKSGAVRPDPDQRLHLETIRIKVQPVHTILANRDVAVRRIRVASAE